jgi:uncharacterized protein YndB with AHSA1/START domain
MARIVFEISIEAPPEKIVQALDTQGGIAGWWTPTVESAGGAGSVLRPRFAQAPAPFELAVDEVDKGAVQWTSAGAFPPHWAGTTITWRLTPQDERTDAYASLRSGTLVHLSHDGWASDDGSFPSAALTLGPADEQSQAWCCRFA